jgi:hypothetical protein
MPLGWHSRFMNESRTDIVIRRADASDARALWRLAALDSAPAPAAGPGVHVAEVAGRIVAAVAGSRAIADPFQPTAAAVDLLRMRARQVAASSETAPPRRAPHAGVAAGPLPQV